MAELVAEGGTMTASLDAVGGADMRQSLYEAHEEFDAARHAARLAMVAFALEEGATMAQMGRSLGISRQLVSRFASEIG